MKALSVITVTFNAQHTLERTLKSVNEQTYPFIEHIIVDGNSNDGTLELISRNNNKRVKWISEADNGIYDAMNKGVEMASGHYLCFLNAGDTFNQAQTVEMMFKSLKQNQHPDILYGETAIVDDCGEFLHMRRLKAPESLDWKRFKKGMLVCHQAFITKRELFVPYDLSYRYSSDFDWAIRMMKKSNDIYNTRLTLINYLKEGATTTNRIASLKERYRIMVKHYGVVSTFFHHLWFIIRAVLK